MDGSTLALLALCLVAFGLISGRLERSVLTPPMAFAILGLALSPHGLGWITIDLGDELVHLLAELTLVLVLFTDASRIDLSLLRREHDLPMRLLGVGMPLTLFLGTVLAWWILPELGLWPAALLSAILAPTDAALGQAVVSDTRIPTRVRQALNAESGLNDGIALPVVLLFLSLCGVAAGPEIGGNAAFWVRFAALQILLGPLVGVAVGWIGGRLVDASTRRGWMSESFQGLAALGLSMLAFGAAEMVHGNGFLAAFCAGLTVGNVTRHLCSRLYEFGEEEGQLLTLGVFFIFGGALFPGTWELIDLRVVLYAALSLTVIRMLPVALSLLGKGLRRETVLFFSWFGPRGIASILFALLVLERVGAGLPRHDLVIAVVMTTVALSILAHGITAYPAAGWLARRLEPHKGSGASEHEDVGEMPPRVRYR